MGGGGGGVGLSSVIGCAYAIYWMDMVQLVPPAGSYLMTLFSSEQKPRSPVLPIV
jgi:hypothetical protein